MTVDVYFLRHGETAHSQTGGFCGWTDSGLTDAGKLMGKQFAEAYKDLKWEALYCSSLSRAIDTARPLADAVGLELQLRDGLKEVNYGEWEHKTHEIAKVDYAEDFKRWIADPAWNSPPGGETIFQVAQRAGGVVEEILDKHKSGNVLVVAHKASIRSVLCSLLGIELGKYRYRLNIMTGSVSRVSFGQNGPMLQSLGDRSHLSADLRARPGT